ncbi:thioredoxin-like protein CITRX, chloroplastic isoform X3 [Phoenix dactylifera]|uniref:Thioredoxin-like protein CITRX, chloroplastic isoform X3 n=1 Tax=Phoenix dactylifera TaxID=42345 RepID=A0A8B9A4C7_PHODC|nr:thioredoxin-like protein CITRX, chloroplastic isoform X3 [Phoenix dactylifera]
MAAVLQSSTSSGFVSPRLSTPRSTFFGLSNTKPLSFWISLSRRSSSSVRRLVSKTLSAKYIREDYLVLAVEYESNALFVKVDTDDEYEFARAGSGTTNIVFYQPRSKQGCNSN